MTGNGTRARICVLLCLILALLWPSLALAQISDPPPAPVKGANAPALPDAPSASAPPPRPVRKNNEDRASAAQSWWLVSPANAAYRPLSPREKFQSFLHHSYSPYMFLGAIEDATWAQTVGDPYQYGGGMQGWGKRIGAAVGGSESRSFFGTFLFPVLLHQDPRYFALYHGPVVQRGFHAVSRVFVTREDTGKNTFNTAGVLAIAFAESLGVAWAPEGQRTPGTLGLRILGAVQSDATSNVLREFTPDFLRLFNRFAPKRVQRIEKKLPTQITGDTTRP